MKLTPLGLKALRDAWRLRGQLLAISLVVASGVATFVTMRSALDSMGRAMDEFYAEQRFADVFSSVKKAPRRLETELQGIPGVASLETRVVADVTLGVTGVELPITGRIISLPDDGAPKPNLPMVTLGRLPEPGHAMELALYDAFAEAHGLLPGDTISAIIQERRVEFTVVGRVMSPEYVLARAPSSIAPDSATFGVSWARRGVLAAAFNMQGAFNDVSLRLSEYVEEEAVLRDVDRILDPFGGFGAYARDEQDSHWFLANELEQLGTLAAILPTIFLAVAMFLFAIVLGRIIRGSRAEIAVLKAFGYSNRAVGLHFGTLILLVSAAASVIGLAAGKWMGSGLLDLYRDSFRFPNLEHHVAPNIALFAVGIATASGIAGAMHALIESVRLTPAEAMHAPAPASYRRSVVERLGLGDRLPVVVLIMLRNIARQPFRSLMNVLGTASGGALLLSGLAVHDSMEGLLFLQFDVLQHEDVSVTLAAPRSAEVLNDLEHLPGVRYAEGIRMVPARISHGLQSMRIALEGVDRDARLRPRLERLPVAGTVALPSLFPTATLAKTLGAKEGDEVLVELLDGTRARLTMVVSGIDPLAIGAGARTDLADLSGRLGSGPAYNGAHLTVDEDRVGDLNRALGLAPLVSAYRSRRSELDRFQEQSAESMNFMAVFLVLFATVLVTGVVYNNARIALAERGRELASMRVLGYRRGEIAAILLGELSLLSVLSIPIGFGLGWLLAWWTFESMNSEMFTIPLEVHSTTYARTALVVLGATLLAGLLVRGRLDRLDLVEVLKSRA